MGNLPYLPSPEVPVRSLPEGTVILRVIRGRADLATASALNAALIETLGPCPSGPSGPSGASGAPGISGPDRYHLGVRPSDDELDVLVLSCWASAEAAADGDRRDISPLRLASRHLDHAAVDHFEVDMNVLRDPDVHPIALRLATGRFLRPGGDIQMQDLLRKRLPGLGPEMTEAYVGRRLHGRAVDVTFVSAWQALPADQSLEEPFWSDIAVRYDEFVVEVYRSLAESLD